MPLMQVRVPEAADIKLRLEAARAGISKHELVRLLLKDWADRPIKWVKPDDSEAAR